MFRENSTKSKEATARLGDILKEYSVNNNKQKALQNFFQWNKKYRSKETYNTTKPFFRRLL